METLTQKAEEILREIEALKTKAVEFGILVGRAIKEVEPIDEKRADVERLTARQVDLNAQVEALEARASRAQRIIEDARAKLG